MKPVQAILIPVIAAIAALLPSATAYAASDPCNLGGKSSPLNLTNSFTFCEHTHGVGAQLTIDNSGACANFTFNDHTVNGTVYVSMVDGNGNCIRAHSDEGVYVNSGSCNVDGSSPDMHELWYDTPDGPAGSGECLFENGAGLFMIVTNDGAGNKVWVGLTGGGNWSNWKAYLAV